MGQWVQDAGTWLPEGTWAACEDPRPIPPTTDVVLGVDGSFSGDATAVVAVTVGELPHVAVVECWEAPEGAPDWRVPILEVEQAIRDACRRYQVRAIVFDPFRWARTMQILEGEGLPVLEYPQSPGRMVPATTRFYEAVVNQALTHSGDPRLARHVANCVIRTDPRGVRLAKEHKHSKRRIDLAVAAVMALDEAATTVAAPSFPPPEIF
jgi:phage terminase large subunit-like protein